MERFGRSFVRRFYVRRGESFAETRGKVFGVWRDVCVESDGIGYAEEQFVPGTRTVETERRAESTKSGFVWEEVSLIEGEQVSSNANTGAASNDKEENELSPSVQHQHHNQQQEDKDDPQAESQPRYDESNYYDQTDENEQEQKQEEEPENDEPLEIIWQTL